MFIVRIQHASCYRRPVTFGDRRLIALALAFSWGCADAGSLPAEEELAELLARDYCDSLERCDCESLESSWGGYEDCVQVHIETWLERQVSAQQMGLSFSATCVQEKLDHGSGCETPEDLAPGSSSEELVACNYYYGELEVGEACVGQPGVNDCRQGLVCPFDLCTDLNDQEPDDDTPIGGDCTNSSCEGAAYCDSNFLCVPLHNLGEGCDLDSKCLSNCCRDALCEVSAPWVCGWGCADEL